jgi:hypothetical protein
MEQRSKIKLNLDDVVVESFVTGQTGEHAMRGTVHGHSEPWSQYWTCYTSRADCCPVPTDPAVDCENKAPTGPTSCTPIYEYTNCARNPCDT